MNYKLFMKALIFLANLYIFFLIEIKSEQLKTLNNNSK